MNFGELLDRYSLQARLQPALLTLIPTILTAGVWYPQHYSLGTTLVGVGISCGLTVLLAHVARSLGRHAETVLYEEWGGRPTTVWLRYRDTQLDHLTKTRYRAFLEQRVPGWVNPTIAQEIADPAGADAAYEAAVKWLLEYTRDTSTFALVFKENISYGFRRNLYGLRRLGFIVAAATLAINLREQAIHFHSGAGEVHFAGATLVVICLVMMICWSWVVSKAWVKDAADAYARALLAACDRVLKEELAAR